MRLTKSQKKVVIILKSHEDNRILEIPDHAKQSVFYAVLDHTTGKVRYFYPPKATVKSLIKRNILVRVDGSDSFVIHDNIIKEVDNDQEETPVQANPRNA